MSKKVMSPEKQRAARRFWTVYVITCIPLAAAIVVAVILFPSMYPPNAGAIRNLLLFSGPPLLISIALLPLMFSRLKGYNSIG